MLDIKTASFTDLYNLYLFVSARFARMFKDKSEKQLVTNRLAEIEAELYDRAFGSSALVIEGQEPMQVVSQFEVAK
jgi:hypothetical protein